MVNLLGEFLVIRMLPRLVPLARYLVKTTTAQLTERSAAALNLSFSLYWSYLQTLQSTVTISHLSLADPVKPSMTVSSNYTPANTAEDITIEKDGGVMKERKVISTVP